MSSRMPPLNPLRTFEVAARHLSFSRAADELFVTAAAVSHQIKTLEDSLGVRLFTRQGNSLALTETGTTYLPAIQQAFKQVAEATYRLHKRDQRPTLKMNVPPTFAVKWLIPRLDQFFKLHPDIDVKVSTSNHMVDFSRENFDLVMCYGRGHYPGMQSKRCLPVEVFPVCSPRLLDAGRPVAGPADLKHYTLLHDDSVYSDGSNPDWSTWFDFVGCTEVDATRGPSFWPSHLVIDAAIDGLGVALAKKPWVDKDLESGRLVRLSDVSLPVEYSYYIVYPDSRAEDPLITTFVEWVQSQGGAAN